VDGEVERALLVADRWLETGKPDRALAALDQLGDRAAESASAYGIRAGALLRLGRPDLAAQAAGAGLRLDPEDVNLLWFLAHAQEDLGDRVAAEATYVHLRALHPTNAVVCMGYARLLAALKREPQARFLLEEAARLDPDAPGLTVARASVAHLSGRHDETVAWARQAVADDPGDPRGHALLGAAQLGLRQYGDAAGPLARAAALKPSDQLYTTLARGSTADRLALGPRSVAGILAVLAMFAVVVPQVGVPLLVAGLVTVAVLAIRRR
jgi:tetratricopeptide (TPR) repeat protein